MPRLLRRMRRLILLLTTLALMTATTTLASTFDAEGRLHLDGVVQIDFDDAATVMAAFPLVFNALDGSVTPTQQVQNHFLPNPNALEGVGQLVLRTQEAAYATLDVTAAAQALEGRRTQLTVWQHASGTLYDLQLYVRTSSGAFVTNMGLHPTGRLTSDGWREYSTGPFDARFGAFGPVELLMVDEQYLLAQQTGRTEFDNAATASLDGLEFVDLGPALVPAVGCSLVDEDQVCGPQGVCQWGQCVDAAFVHGPVLDDDDRAQMLSRLEFVFTHVEGGRIPQQRLATLQTTFSMLRQEAADATFWPTVREAIADLHDGHSAAPTWAYPQPMMGGVCLGFGEADLLPGGGLAPLVFSTAGTGPLADVLQEGDVLVDVDGLDPVDWMHLADRLLQHGGDPAGDVSVLTPSLMLAAAQTGATLTFERCTPSSPTTPCDAGDVDMFSFDLAELIGVAALSTDTPVWAYDAPLCDHRFRRQVQGDPSAYAFAGSRRQGGITTLLINGVPGSQGDDGADWHAEVTSTLAAQPDKLILDQRTGHGGTIEGVDALVSYLVDGNDYYAVDLLSWWETPVTYVEKQRTMNCSLSTSWLVSCAGDHRWPWAAFSVGNGQASSTKLAVLNVRDVSGNDYTSRILQMRSGQTRIFGHGAADVAYGVIYRLPRLPGSVDGGSVQIHDTLFLASTADPNLDFQTALGVRPDEEVFQKQSDALLGRDTVVEAARSWLNSTGGTP